MLGLSSFRMRCHFRLGGQLEFDAVGGRTRGLGLSSFGCGVTSDWVASWSLTRLEDGHGGWDCLISDAVLLQTGWPVGVGRGWRTDTGVGTVLFRMRCVTSDWVAS